MQHLSKTDRSSSFITLTYFYPLTVGVEFYFCALATLNETHTHIQTYVHTVGLTWTRDQPVIETATCTTRIIHKRQTSMLTSHPPQWDSNPQSQQASGRRPTALDHAAC